LIFLQLLGETVIIFANFLGVCDVTKMKTVKAIKARFRVTASGKLKRGRPGKRHILTKKSSKRKHHLETSAYVSVTQTAMYKRLMGV
jgi:large subunit ribosomal protein L35